MLRVTMLLLAGGLVAGTAAQAAEGDAPAKPENSAPAKSESAAPAKTENAAAAKPENATPPKSKSAKPRNTSPTSRTYAAARQLPPGLPRPGYRYRTTVAPATPYRDPVVVETDESLLITDAYGPGGYIRNLPGTPILPGSSTIPGYYGRAFSYDYQGPYYGGPYEGYFWRLPYACGVYGYC